MEKFELALHYLNQGNLVKGRELLEELLTEHPKNRQVLYNLGMVYSEMGEYERSAELLETALVFDPLDANVYAALGFTYSKMGMLDKAREKLEYALKAHPDNIYAMKNLAAILGNLGEHEKALELFEKIGQPLSGTPEVLFGKAHILFDLQRYPESAEILKEVINHPKTNDSIYGLAKDMMNQIVRKEYADSSASNPRMDVIFYCVSALEYFNTVPKETVKKITFEIAILGTEGIDIHDPEQKYTLNNMKGTFSGMQLIAYEFVGFKLIEPTMDMGFDLENEYQQALKMLQMKKNQSVKAKTHLPEGLELIPEVLEILEDIAKRTGKEVSIEMDASLYIDASTTLGLGEKNTHHIRINPKVERKMNHLVLHECGHIIRFFDAPEEERLVPAGNYPIYHKVKERLKSEMGSAEVPEDVIRLWINGLVQQLVSLSVDFRIERWVYDTFPMLRKEQKINLEMGAKLSVLALSKQVQMVTAPSIYTASNIMNCAYIMLLGDLLSKHWVKEYYRYPSILSVAKSLKNEAPLQDMGQKGDIELTNIWAKKLGLDEWFIWIMPE